MSKERKNGLDIFGIGSLSENSMELVKLTYPDLFQPGLKEIGSGVKTIIEFSLTPLLFLKLGSEGAKLLFERNLKALKEKLIKIPDGKLITPPREIAANIIDHLTVVTNEDLADLFITLFTKAAHINTINKVHPRYVNVLKEMSYDESIILKHLGNHGYIKSLFLAHNSHEFKETRRELFNFPKEVNEQLINSKTVKLSIENLEMLGIIKQTRQNRNPLLAKFDVWETFDRNDWLDAFEDQYSLIYSEVVKTHELLDKNEVVLPRIQKGLFQKGEIGNKESNYSYYQIRDTEYAYVLTDFGKGLLDVLNLNNM
ncbi:Abi-alpha family protein [Aquimarina sp. 2201CG14-23]|uniref:Abi-alpha family protein n=1 Tax=Aquimarina mycalae TaxID=3040073 RepID=UPI002477D0DC|nr:Abi-alpha family protein [Aquimarina sp. 2201CG14-23]MDH7447234.1 Abi-alpha family protein [Aquimarina sp. 2201CG14-23]